jgi:DNA repair photolyase
LSDVAERPIAARESGNRPGCRCALSRDIGAYDTCPHGCVYCYAVTERDRTVANFRAHDPVADCLMPARKPIAMVQAGAATLAASRS